MLRYDRQIKPGLVTLVQHPARKWSGSILTTLEPAQGSHYRISPVTII